MYEFQSKRRGWSLGTTGGSQTHESIFKEYIEGKTIFTKNRDALRSSYVPDKLPHRNEQIDQLASIISTAFKGEKPSNILLFGKTGTGKTATAKFIGNEIGKTTAALPSSFSEVKYIYINCEVVDTQYGVLQNIGNRFIDDFNERIPPTGWSTERVFNILWEKIDHSPKVVVVVLDEIDRFVYKSGDDTLYHLTKINDDMKNAKISIIGISNDLRFTDLLDPRVRSRLSDEKVVFPPYDADQLKDILWQRAKIAFDKEVIDESVITLCAAVEAHEHGDARRALDLLRVAAELAERNHDKQITEQHVIKAKNKIELDCVIEAVKTLPIQSKLVLLGILLGEENGNPKQTTGDVYSAYKELAKKSGTSLLTQRRVADLVSEMDMMGLVYARVKSFGRGGRTREIQASIPLLDTKRILEKDPILESVKDYKLKRQSTLM